MVILAYSDSGHVEREQENKIRVELTKKILENIGKLPPLELENQIREIQRKLYDERKAQAIAARLNYSKKKKPDPGNFKLSCVWCRSKATTSDQFRKINEQQYVLIDKEFRNRVVFKKYSKPDEEHYDADDEFVIGTIHCKNQHCKRVWGSQNRHLSFPISLLKIESFLITDDNGYRDVIRKWKDAPFEVSKTLTSEDLAELFGGGNESDDDNDEN